MHEDFKEKFDKASDRAVGNSVPHLALEVMRRLINAGSRTDKIGRGDKAARNAAEMAVGNLLQAAGHCARGVDLLEAASLDYIRARMLESANLSAMQPDLDQRALTAAVTEGLRAIHALLRESLGESPNERAVCEQFDAAARAALDGAWLLSLTLGSVPPLSPSLQ